MKAILLCIRFLILIAAFLPLTAMSDEPEYEYRGQAGMLKVISKETLDKLLVKGALRDSVEKQLGKPAITLPLTGYIHATYFFPEAMANKKPNVEVKSGLVIYYKDEKVVFWDYAIAN